jgi:hypothetical protein
VATLAGCSAKPPQDCEVAHRQTLQCIERYRGQSGARFLLGCYPFSEPERISGAWIAGFETNEFYEGARASPALMNMRVGDTQLEVEGLPTGGPQPLLYQMEFFGRRSRCDMGFPRHIIVVQHIVSRREVGP